MYMNFATQDPYNHDLYRQNKALMANYNDGWKDLISKWYHMKGGYNITPHSHGHPS